MGKGTCQKVDLFRHHGVSIEDGSTTIGEIRGHARPPENFAVMDLRTGERCSCILGLDFEENVTLMLKFIGHNARRLNKPHLPIYKYKER